MFSERVFVLKSVRLLFTKSARARFVSHLDINRFMTRIVRKAKLDIWYTEGFNPHPYITFALPLPLGFEGKYEIMDIRINDDNAPLGEIVDKLNSVCPPDIRFFDAVEPIKKVGEIGYATYDIVFDDNGNVAQKLKEFIGKDKIVTKKRTKKGDYKEIDIKEKIKAFDIGVVGNETKLSLVLPAGSDDNINPALLIDSFYNDFNDEYYCYTVTRTSILDKNMEKFI